jgi:hypothetical protein
MSIRYAVFLIMGAFAAVGFAGFANYTGMGTKFCPWCESMNLFRSRVSSLEWPLIFFAKFYRCGSCQRRMIKFRTVPIRSAGGADKARP